MQPSNRSITGQYQWCDGVVLSIPIPSVDQDLRGFTQLENFLNSIFVLDKSSLDGLLCMYVCVCVYIYIMRKRK